MLVHELLLSDGECAQLVVQSLLILSTHTKKKKIQVNYKLSYGNFISKKCRELKNVFKLNSLHFLKNSQIRIFVLLK